MTDETRPTEPPVKRPKAARRVWLSPGGISAMAAVLAAIAALIGLFLQRAEPTAVQQNPSMSAVSPAVDEPALFVYGSSMPGMSRYDQLSKYVVRSARDSVQGRLYDSGLGYPMAKFDGDGQVRGVVLWLDPATAEAAMTEMTKVESGLFHPRRVRTASGITAQAYEWIGSTDGYPRIDSWDGSTGHYGERLPWTELAGGACFQPSQDDYVVTMWCEAPHAWEAFQVGTLAAGRSDAAARSACADAFGAFVGREPDRSELVMRTYVEPPGTGTTRSFLCAVGLPGQVAQSGSLQNADR